MGRRSAATATSTDARRARFAPLLRGRGLEIGALRKPFPVADDVEVVYSDLLPPEEIDRHYPGGVHPDIVSDSESFPTVEDDTFDFLIANHVLEHLTDPIRALREWHRILGDGGLVLMALPDKRYTFDVHRRRTTLAHLIADSSNNLTPRLKNYEHLVDWATHVEGLDPASPEWCAWIEDRFETGFAVHNHVWVLQDILYLLLYLYQRRIAPFALARWNNTALFGNEFIVLLRARKQPGRARLASDVARLTTAVALAWLQNPWQVTQAACKRQLKKRKNPAHQERAG
ncbi:MAG: class I SAM-dependent methyltransferase [Acidobacteriota bacterium]